LDQKKIKIDVYNAYGAIGLQLRFIIKGNDLKIKENNDFRLIRFEKKIYKGQIDPLKYNSFYEFVNRINFDTLKNYYETPYILDGIETTVSIKIDKKTKSIRLINYEHPVIDSLFIQIDKLIDEKKHKIYH